MLQRRDIDIQIVEGYVIKFGLSQEEYEAIKQALPTHRDVLIAKLLRGTGKRIAEILRIRPIDLYRDHRGYWLRIVIGKKQAGVPVYQDAPLKAEDGLALFEYQKGNKREAGDRIFHITARHFRRVFAQAAINAIGRPVNPHELRKLYATNTSGLKDE